MSSTSSGSLIYKLIRPVWRRRVFGSGHPAVMALGMGDCEVSVEEAQVAEQAHPVVEARITVGQFVAENDDIASCGCPYK